MSLMNKKEPTYDNYPFWDAYKAVKNGEWTEEEFHIWASTVWNDGADSEKELYSH
jgi:hypothetical protein